MSGRVYQGDNEDLLAEGKLAGRAEMAGAVDNEQHEIDFTEAMAEVIDKFKDEPTEQAELHWDYVEKTLQIHCIDQSELDLCAHHYKTAFIHGWKHGQEAMNEKF